jgi:coenzyme F420-reducing hydrogenase delta subunit
VSCGICAGACPTSTPFRRTTELIPGIDLPEMTIRALREQTLAATANLSGAARVLVFGCRYGPDLQALQGPGVGLLALPCIAMLPPSFLDFVITRRHADGVLLTGCPAGNCHHRLGIEWTQQRLAGERDPYLRKRVPRERIHECWVGISGLRRLQKELAAFRAGLKALGPLEREPPQPVPQASGRERDHRA